MIETLIVGGGPAGSAAAIRLARAGREVVLVERERGPHDKVCGEFLSGPSCAVLHGLGIDPAALGARPIRAVALYRGAARIEAGLPFVAQSLSRRVLDEALLSLASAAGATVRRGVRARSLEGERGDWRVATDAGDLQARDVLVATGKHNLRGCRRGKGGQSDLVGFKLHLDLAAGQRERLEGEVELHLFEGGYAGLELVEGGLANLCLVVRKARLGELRGDWDSLRAAIEADAPLLAERLAGARPRTRKPLAISGIPYGYVGRGGDGLWRLGDQAAVIPSFAGEGMAIALQSGVLAARFILAGKGPDAFQSTLARHVRAQVRGATLLSQVLVTPPGQTAAMGVARTAPGLVGWIAGRTRVHADAAAP
jgi:flavin-dependent dehydrogenase